MKIDQKTVESFNKLCEYAPQPWYLDQCNSEGVVVKDNRGEIIFAEFFDEETRNLNDMLYTDTWQRANRLAQFLLSFQEPTL